MFNLFKKNKTPLINWVVPNDQGELVLVFDKGQYRIFPTKDHAKTLDLSLDFMHQFSMLTFTPQEVKWRNGKKLDKRFLYAHSVPAGESALEAHTLLMNGINRDAVWVQGQQHFYNLSLYPFRAEKIFMLCEFTAGGHAGEGGCADFTVQELLAYAGWKTHFVNAGCGWAVEMVEALKDDREVMVRALVAGGCDFQH